MNDTANNHSGEQPRDGLGKFRRTPEGVERDIAACKMYVAGKTYQEISDALNYGGFGNARRGVQKILLDPARRASDEMCALLQARNEEIYVMARDIALKDHLAHSHGKVVYDYDMPVYDDGPKLSAMDRMTRSLGEIAKLTGAYSPQKFENLSLEAVQAEIARLEEEAREAGENV